MSAVSVTRTPPAAPGWRGEVRSYARPSLRRSLLGLATSLVPYLLLWAAMYLLAGTSVLLSLALAPLAAGFLLRTFILFHDCTHGSLFAGRRANRIVGTLLGLLLLMPFEAWRWEHAMHHASAGDLDRRGLGDVDTLTVTEYRAKGFWGRLGYRLFRNPLVMFGLGPLLAFVIAPRVVPREYPTASKRSIIATDLVLPVIIAGMCLLLGAWRFLLVEAPAAWLAGAVGIFMFYVQHQFEGVYWEKGADWDFVDAALRGSSYLQLPAPLAFFTGNIGFHHVHHLNARIPNYSLPQAHEELEIFRDVPVLTLAEALKATRLKLWDEDQNRLVGFSAASRAEPKPVRA